MKTTTFTRFRQVSVSFCTMALALLLALSMQAQTKFVPGSTSGAADNTLRGVKVFPNPVKDFLNISLISPQDGSVEIYDRKMYLRKETKIGQYEKLVSIDLTDLEGGTYYIVRVIQGQKMYVVQVRKI